MDFPDTLHQKSAQLISLCRSKGLTLAAAESCTGGLLCTSITEHAGVSDIFMGGAVTYSNDAKHEILEISAVDIDRYGAVSEHTAKSMAYNACTRFDADAAAAITGIAGPSGGSDDKPVGTVDIATAVRGQVVYKRHLFEGDRHSIRAQAAEAALDMLITAVGKV
jgi:PncC family amidohydrolase